MELSAQSSENRPDSVSSIYCGSSNNEFRGYYWLIFGENILNFNPAGSEYGYWSMNIDNPTENTGSITITNINTTNKTISGTFNFKGYWSDATVTNILPTVFTNGVFQNVPYIVQAETGDTFFAKVNGIEFDEVDILAAEIGIAGQDFISVAAQDEDFNSMTVSVRANLGAGTYPITGNIATDVVQASYTFDDEDFASEIAFAAMKRCQDLT